MLHQRMGGTFSLHGRCVAFSAYRHIQDAHGVYREFVLDIRPLIGLDDHLVQSAASLCRYLYRSNYGTSKHDTLKQCWFNVDQASTTLAQHLSNIAPCLLGKATGGPVQP